tara:strand:+ start:50 stop:235 length:186 start_codon:yes stop_codon:yes gene_type:complete
MSKERKTQRNETDVEIYQGYRIQALENALLEAQSNTVKALDRVEKLKQENKDLIKELLRDM